MQQLKIKKYKGYQIHVVNGIYKYDIYDTDAPIPMWHISVNSLKDAKEYINHNLFMRRHIRR